MPSDSLTVKESFVGLVGKEERMFRQGDLIRANDPAAKKWPDLFVPAEYANEPVVEQATAAPGEKRPIRFRRQVKAKAKAKVEPPLPEPEPVPEPEPEPEKVEAEVVPEGKAISLASLEGKS